MRIDSGFLPPNIILNDIDAGNKSSLRVRLFSLPLCGLWMTYYDLRARP
jgi:hypothetical protein